MTTWRHPSDHPPKDTPVLAEYHEYGREDMPIASHVVWWRDGCWRPYPEVIGDAFVKRWRFLDDESAVVANLMAERAEMIDALMIFTRHYEKWMDEYPDDWEASTFSPVTLGQLRAAMKLVGL
jgi:hypothetical protein